MSGLRSGIYEGVVTHRRLRPRRQLGYRIFQLLLDLDELSELDRTLKLFGHNRRALLSLRDRDHGPGDGRPLRPWVEGELAKADIELEGGAIRLLCMPRVLGQAFNPLSLYYCHRRDGALAAVLYEVNNTFGQRHCYLIPVTDGAGPTVRQACAKQFYVSPLMDMDLGYAFDLRLPGEDVMVSVRCDDKAGPLLLASFTGSRRELDDRALLGAFLRHPLLMLKVLAGIHWEALKTLLSGARFHPRPPAPARPVTVASSVPLERAA